MECLRVFGNYNPSGIEIYPGYYALLGCILLGMGVEESIAKIMYGKEYNRDFKPQHKPSKRQQICDAYKAGEKDYRVLAKRFNCGKHYVWDSLIAKGVIRHTDYMEKGLEIMKHNPDINAKELEAELNCGTSTAYRVMRRYYKENGIGYFD